MGKPITVYVTQEDIDKAWRNNSSKCVVAQAIARTIPHATRVDVDVQTVRFTDSEGVRRVYLTPMAVEKYVIDFDAGDPIEPFKFGLYDTQRVNVPRKTRTPAGKKRETAAKKVTREKAKVAALAVDPAATPAQRTVAQEKLTAAVEHQETVTQETQGERSVLPLPDRMPPPNPEVIAKPHVRRAGPGKGTRPNERHYGHRVLRINQQRPGTPTGDETQQDR